MKYAPIGLWSGTIGLALSLLSDPVAACSYIPMEYRYFSYAAAQGDAFFVHLEPDTWNQSDEEVSENLEFLDRENNTYPVEVISRAGSALAIRAPELPAGTQLQLSGVGLSRPEWGDVPDFFNIIESAPDEADLVYPEDVVIHTVVAEVVANQVPLTPMFMMDSCGGMDGPALMQKSLNYLAQVHFPKTIFEDGPLILDLWGTQESENLADVDEPIVGGALVGLPESLSETSTFVQETDETVFFILTAPMTTQNAQLHFRFRNPRTGAAGDIFTKTVHLPESHDTSMAVGCQALPQTPFSLVGLFSLLFGMMLYRRRGR